MAATQFELSQKMAPAPDAARQAREYVRRHWKYCEFKPGFEPSTELLERAGSHFLCISGMAFQDAWNIDLERLQRCCVHVMTGANKLVPFCSYYMTDTLGRRLMDQRLRVPM